MPIISKKESIDMKKIKSEISAEIFNKIEKYMKWADIPNIGHFIEESAKLVFSKDKEWKQFEKNDSSI